jgi:hypothetical protein
MTNSVLVELQELDEMLSYLKEGANRELKLLASQSKSLNNYSKSHEQKTTNCKSSWAKSRTNHKSHTLLGGISNLETKRNLDNNLKSEIDINISNA